ncbi:MAG TPA: hypothetical protein VN829_17310 [Dongiaceae bacterium]|nr:hypothetical protein [Dongiaceae bacterium]
MATTRYALVPQAGLWDRAHLWQECQRWHEPLVGQLMLNPPPHQPLHASLLRIEGGSLDLPTMLVGGNALIVRRFNAEDDPPAQRISVAWKPAGAELIELDGRVREKLKLSHAKATAVKSKLVCLASAFARYDSSGWVSVGNDGKAVSLGFRRQQVRMVLSQPFHDITPEFFGELD